MLKWENRMLSIFHFNFPHVGQSDPTRPNGPEAVQCPGPAQATASFTQHVHYY